MNCRNCNKPAGTFGNREKKYCSPRCHYEYYLNKGKKVFKPKPCAICGNKFTPRDSLNKYCSPACGYEADKRRVSKKPLTKECLFCGDEFKPYTSLDKFCSANCRVENQKVGRSCRWSNESVRNITGKNNPAYRNGNYQRGAKRNNDGTKLFLRNIAEIRQQMLEDPGYIYCEFCGVTVTARFEGHHIIFRSEKPKHPSLHDKVNLINLCIKCHNDFHKSKGLRNKIVKHRELHKIFGNDVLDKRVLN